MSNADRSDPAVQLLLGPETGRKREHIDKIRRQLEKRYGPDLEEHRRYAYETDPQELVGLLNNLSLFSSHRLVLVFEAQQFTKKAQTEPLKEYIEHPSESSTLVLVSEEYHIDRRIEGAVPKKQVTMFWELFENQKRSWIQGFFRNEGYTVTNDAIDLILELVENDTADLRRECEKLVTFYPQGTTVGEVEVERILYHSKNENVFSLFVRVADADFAAALDTLQAITLSGSLDPAGLFGGLSWQIRRLLGFRRLKDAHYSDEDAARSLKIRGKRNLRTHRTGAQRYTTRDLERMYRRTFEYDVLFREMRTGVDRSILDLYLYELMVSRGEHPLFRREGVPQ